MRKLFKRYISFFLIPLTNLYLRKERIYRYERLTIKVFPGVFHPGLFHSTKFLLRFLSNQPIRDKSLLELGCGTGLISIYCSENGATVTASDVSQTVIENITANANYNQVNIEIVRSDVFDHLDKKKFDWIIINPPYYAKKVSNESELAWHCGEHFEYFQKLFETLAAHIHESSNIIMVLTLGCELDKIFSIAAKNGFQFQLLMERNAFFDGKDFIYKIIPAA